MGLQKQFEDFHQTIKMDFDVKTELAEKRDILIQKLLDCTDVPGFKYFNQGSYAMHTGVIHLDKEYDIDVGLKFNVNKADYTPTELKQLIHNELEDHTDYGADMKNPCVTVRYKKGGELAYHVDLVAYAYEDKDDHTSQLYLARGKNSGNESWEKADPQELVNQLNTRFENIDERNQYRRVIRYMKRWKNIAFTSAGNAEPQSIGIALLAHQMFVPNQFNYLQNVFEPNDFKALKSFVSSVRSSFTSVYSSEEVGMIVQRIMAVLPSSLKFEPSTDVFRKMSDKHMGTFWEKIDYLHSTLESVASETDLVEQCKLLQKVFGEDFVIPEVKDVSKQQANYFPARTEAG